MLTEKLLNRKENSLNDYGDFNHYGSSGSGQHHKWEKFTKLKETCPICNGTHKRCRTNGSLVICGEDSQVSNWKNLGQDKAGIGYLYRPDSSQLSKYEKLPKPVPVKPPKVSHLTQGEINNLLLDMLCQEKVEDWAKADLLRRGIEPTELLGKSFPKGVIDDKYEELPGTYRDSQGRLRAIAPNDSYFCPIFNEDGLVIGGQLKVRDGKYIWLSAGNKGGYSQRINGKTPHTLCDSNKDKRSKFVVNEGKGNKQRSNVILFSEGVLKPYIINQLSGYPCIGAVGGNFKGNFEQINQFILKITNNNLGQFTFAIAADAGSGINKSVMNQYAALVKHIKQKYDKNVYVIWYGQFTKLHDDFDDILTTGKTSFSLIPFVRFSKKHQEFEALEEKNKFTSEYKISERYLPVNDSYWGWQSNSIVDFTRSVNKNIRTILALKSPMGTGKTEALKKILELLHCGIFLIGYRNSLLLQTGRRIPGIYHRTEVVNELQFSAKLESISLCMDSIWSIKVSDVRDKVLVLDEAPLVIEHLLTSDTCKSRRSELISHFWELLKNCAGVVIMSDQLTDREVALIQKTSGIEDKGTLAVENAYQMPSREVIVYEHEKHLREVLNDAITEGKRIFLATDSQKFTDAWGRKTTEEIKSDCRTLIINSETLYKKEVKDFLKSPDEHLYLYDFVLTSPTAESGLSINERGYCDEIFVRWTHLGLDACTQIMHRVRDTDCPVHLFAPKCRNGSKTGEDLLNEEIDRISAIWADEQKLRTRYEQKDASSADVESFAKFLFDSAISMSSIVSDYKKSPFTEYLNEIKEIRLLEQHSLRDLLVHDLRVRGYDVKDAKEVEINKDKVSVTKQSETIKQEKSLAIFDANILSDDEYENANRREVKTPEEMAELRKYNLLRQFPGINELDGWEVGLIKELTFDSPENKGKLWKRYLLENEDLNALIRDKKVISSLIHGFSPSDWDITQSVITELKKISYILTPLMKSKSFHSESSLVKVFVCAVEKCKYLPKQGKLGNIQYLNNVLDLIGYKANCRGQVRTKDGSRRREYVIEDNLSYEMGEGKKKREIMLYPLLQECLEKKSAELFEKYDTEYFEKQKKIFLGEDVAEPLFTRDDCESVDVDTKLDDDERDTVSLTDTIDRTQEIPIVSNEITLSDVTLEVDANKVKQVVTYFFNGIRSGVSILDQIASTIEFCGRVVFEQACYYSSLLLGKVTDVDYEFMEA